jgi:hypothetical protein
MNELAPMLVNFSHFCVETFLNDLQSANAFPAIDARFLGRVIDDMPLPSKAP